MMFWAMIEMGIAVVAGCLPTIWPFIRRISLRKLSPRNISRDSIKLDQTFEDVGPYLQLTNQNRNNPAVLQYHACPAESIPPPVVPTKAYISP